MIEESSLHGLRTVVAAVDAGDARYMWTPHHASLVSEVLTENAVLRETVEELESRPGPAVVLALAEILLRSAGDLLAAVVVTDGDSVDHLLTQVRLAEDRVGYERKALAGS